MASYNRITLVGNLKDDVLVSEDKKNGRKAAFDLGVERYNGKDKAPTMDYFAVVCFGKLAEVCGSYLGKGKKVLVDGHIQIRTFTKNNEKQWVTEIVAENLKFLSVPA
jgi:single-strand DNA-binding protein